VEKRIPPKEYGKRWQMLKGKNTVKLPENEVFNPIPQGWELHQSA